MGAPFVSSTTALTEHAVGNGNTNVSDWHAEAA
jgi:hypothetical protein